MLLVKNLTFLRNKKPVLNNINASINKGEIIGVIGSAGSGKNTFIKLLNNTIRNYEGDIFYDDYNFRSADKKKIIKLISHYSEIDNNFNPEATVKEWILGGRIRHKKKLGPYSEIDKNIAYSEMSAFRLNQFAETRLKLISESTRKMATLARTFSSQSDLLLLEKPDARLNLEQRVLLSKCIKKYTSSGSNIVIMTSSDINFIAGTCDRIFVLAEGVIAESGSQKIITSEFIKKYFNIEAVVTKNIYTGLPEIQVIEEN